MPRKNDIATILVVGHMLLYPSSGGAEKPTQVRMVFCIPASNGWVLHQFKPLINPRAKTVFAEMSLAGQLLLEYKLRRFSEHAETAFDYKFDADGRLNSLIGSVAVFGSWIGEASLIPNADGTVPPYQVRYRSEGQSISKPDDAADYIGSFDTVPIYRTTQALPCAAMLKQAEKMNATQE
jgi:hypothetical protein